MSTAQEIEQAIERLPATERNALESRLLARRCGLSALNEGEQAELLASLDEAEREIDEGNPRGPIRDVRKHVPPS